MTLQNYNLPSLIGQHKLNNKSQCAENPDGAGWHREPRRSAVWGSRRIGYSVQWTDTAERRRSPVLSTKEIMSDESLYDGNTLVRINQGGEIGEFVTVGCPFTMSNYQPTYGPAPELGGNTEEVLKSIGYTDEQIASFAKNGTTAPLADGAM